MKFKLIGLAAALLAMSAPAHAASKWVTFSFQEFMAKEENKAHLGDFRIQFGEHASGSVIQTTNSGRPTSAFHKPEQQACERALLNALIAMRDKALSVGGTALTGVHSTNGLVKNKSSEYACSVNHFKASAPVVGSIVR